MLAYIDDREEEDCIDDYGYDYGCEEDYDYDSEKKSEDNEENSARYFD